MNNFKYIDIGILTLLTIGFFVMYAIYAIVYFIKFDKKEKLRNSGEKHGLSRMCLIGIFFLFGLLIFDLMTQFGQIYVTNYLKYDVIEHTITKKMMDKSFIFYSIVGNYQLLPLATFINGMFIVSFFYIGVEGLISCLKTMNIESGLRIELPYKKRVRLANIFYIWCYLSIITTIYTIILGSDTINFYNKNCIFSTIATLIIVILSERSSSALENVSIIKQSDSQKIDMNIIDGASMKEETSIKSVVDNITTIANKIVDTSVVASDKNDDSSLEQITLTGDNSGK